MSIRSIVGYYHGSLVYENQSFRRSLVRTYGKSIVEVTRDAFLNGVNWILETATGRIIYYLVLIIRSPFCAMRYVNDRRYLSGDKAQESERLQEELKNIV